MKKAPMAVAVLGVLLSACVTQSADKDGFAPMFDGKTLAGWQTTGNWVVEDGTVTLRPRPGEEGWERYDAYLTTARTYKDFVEKYIYDGDNLITLDWGCHPKEVRAEYQSPPKVVYMGYLGGYWMNKELLSRLSKRGRPGMIDVYGLPKPEKRFGLNYKGFAEDIDVLNRYQFGLITISKDRLRREGFSAKHLEYLSYGLPVLVPDWREKLELIKGSIPYNEADFLDMMDLYSDEDEWNRMSDMAYGQAQRLDWDITLKELEDIVQKG